MFQIHFFLTCFLLFVLTYNGFDIDILFLCNKIYQYFFMVMNFFHELRRPLLLWNYKILTLMFLIIFLNFLFVYLIIYFIFLWIKHFPPDSYSLIPYQPLNNFYSSPLIWNNLLYIIYTNIFESISNFLLFSIALFVYSYIRTSLIWLSWLYTMFIFWKYQYLLFTFSFPEFSWNFCCFHFSINSNFKNITLVFNGSMLHFRFT